MTTTATAEVSELPTSPAVAIIHATKVTAAIPSTTGTNTPATLSARRAMGALVAFASSTSWMMRARGSCRAPTRVARNVNEPVRLIVAALTVSPAPFSTGMDSPVSADSSTDDAPSITTPSTRNGLARTHHNDVADDDGTRVDADLLAATYYRRRLRGEVDEALDGVASL